MPCGFGRLEVLEAVWMWSVGGNRCGADVVSWSYKMPSGFGRY